MPRAFHVYVGCRTARERNARGDGLQIYRMDAQSGAWTHVQLLAGMENPSFLAFAHTRPILYTVHGDREEVSAFRIDDATGRLTEAAQNRVAFARQRLNQLSDRPAFRKPLDLIRVLSQRVDETAIRLNRAATTAVASGNNVMA